MFWSILFPFFAFCLVFLSQFAGGISVPASSQSPRTHGESSATGDSPVNESNDREQPVSGRDGYVYYQEQLFVRVCVVIIEL